MASSNIGFIGLGNMGSKMARNLYNSGYSMYVYDIDQSAVEKFISECTESSKSEPSPSQNDCNIVALSSVNDASKHDIVISVLPNDEILKSVVNEMKGNIKQHQIHIGCSTVSPNTSRHISQIYNDKGASYVAAPIFARPENMANMQANFVISGDNPSALDNATAILQKTAAGVTNFSTDDDNDKNDPGAANVVKLCGNFMIGAAIEAMGEALTLAEKNGIDRQKVMNFYSSTFLNSVIYQSYGSRISSRYHVPGGFSLDLGKKDMALVRSVAQETTTPMPFLSVLLDNFTSEQANGRGGLDWSALALGISERAGIDVSSSVLASKDDKEEQPPNKKQKVENFK